MSELLQLVIPARNETARLPRTLDCLRRHAAATAGAANVRIEAIVVDSASTDGTAAVAWAASSAELPVTVLRCERRGKGRAVAAGVAATDASLVGFMDADGATAVEALDRAVAALAAGADAVIGSRSHPESVVTARNHAVRGAGAAVYRRAVTTILPGIADSQCGFKMLDGDLARRAFADLRTQGFGFDVELLVRLRAYGATVVELPVVWDDVPGSTFKPARHGVAAFIELAGIRRRARQDEISRGGARLADRSDLLPPQVCVAPRHA